MQAFIAITLLAACAAAQTFDYQTGLKQHLLRKELGLNGLWNKDVLDVDTLRNVDTTTYNNVNGVNILSLDELIRHPLFQTYYTLPLFRQHFTHPLFQVYLTTPYFQKFWTHPIFPTFFRSSHLFNKFIYPVVYNTVPTTGVEYEQDLGLNHIVGDYKNFPLNVNHVQYGHVMDKIFKHLLVNKPEILEVKTDVKIQTPVEETSFIKRVDPITGEVKYVVDNVNNVEKTVLPVEVINTIRKPIVDTTYNHEITKNALLKKIFLNKIYGQRVPEIYNTDNIYGRDLINTVRPFNTIYNTEVSKDLLKKIFLNKIIYGDRVVPDVYNMNKYTDNVYGRDLIVPDVYNVNKYTDNVYGRDLINTVSPVDTMYDQEHIKQALLKKIFLNKVIYGDRVPSTETFNFNKFDRVIPQSYLNKYESVIPQSYLNKYESVIPRDLVTRELLNKYHTTSVLPREYTENKLENILKSVVV